MTLKNLRSDDSAVSPVIGVILMVAITVILAAVIGTFVLNLGNQVQSSAPQASFSFDQGDIDGDDNGTDVGVTHDGGDTIPKSNLDITVDGENPNTVNWDGIDDDSVSAGSSATISEDSNGDNLENDQTVRVIWTSESGENSQVLAEYTAT